MKKLFERFEELSCTTQELLQQCLQQLREGFAPDEMLNEKITASLASLRTAYDELRNTLPQYVLKEKLPDGKLSVREYEQLWQNCVTSQNIAIRATLEEFVRVYSDERKYMAAVEEHIRAAQVLLDEMTAEDFHRSFPDISLYQLFLDGVKADLSKDGELSDRIWESAAFSRTVIRGLTEEKYHIRKLAGESQQTAEAVEKTEATQNDSESDGTEWTATETAMPSDEAEPKAELDAPETSPPDETAAKQAPAIEDMPEAESTTESESTASTKPEETNAEEFIHPINPIRSAKLPSDQKLKELLYRTRDVSGFLVEKLVMMGLMDENVVFDMLARMQKPVSREQCIDAFTIMERKGLLCTYSYQGRNILCFTELMDACLQKSGLSSIFKRFLGLKRIGRIHFVGRQNLPLAAFSEQLALADECVRVTRMRQESDEGARKLKGTYWNDEKHCFAVWLYTEDKRKMPLRIATADKFAEALPDENGGLLCAAGELPPMEGVVDEAHYCLIPQGLFQWSGGHWKPLAEEDATAPGEEPVVEEEVAPAAPAHTAERKSDEAAEMPAVAAVGAPPAEEKTEGLWLDDLNEEDEKKPEIGMEDFSSLSSYEMAQRLLDSSVNGEIPSDENMYLLIDKLLCEGVRSDELYCPHDQIVEAIVLARLLASSGAFPRCKSLYHQLHAALPIFKENASNTGEMLSGIFAEEMKHTSVAKLCAYLYGMLFPAHTHDHTFAALYSNAFSNFEQQFPQLGLLKPLYHMMMEGLKAVPTGFSPANLTALSDSKLRQERMDVIRSRARALMKPPVVKAKMRGIPKLVELCFGSGTNLYAALETVANHEIDMRRPVAEELAKYCREDEADAPDVSAMERRLDSQWSFAAQKYSSRRMGIPYDVKKYLINALLERLSVLREWLEETDTAATPDIERLRVLRNEMMRLIDECRAELPALSDAAARGMIATFLDLISSKLQNRGSGVSFATLLRSGTLVIEQGEMILNEELNEIKYAEPWRMMLTHIACADYDLRGVYQKLLEADAQSILYDNLGQLEAIGKRIGAEPKEYELSEAALRDAICSADHQTQNFREKLEISYAYNRIGENDRERLAMLASAENADFQRFFYEHKAFGCWRGFLNALRAQIREAAQRSMQGVRAQMEQAKGMLQTGEESPLLIEAERLISQEQNYAVAEDYIHRFLSGERKLPFDEKDDAKRYYLDFISDEVYTKLYSFCERRKESSFAKSVIQYVSNNMPEGWTTRHKDAAERFIEKWPTGKQAVKGSDIMALFRQLGLMVEDCQQTNRGNEVCYTLTIDRNEQMRSKYQHPISMFGTQIKRQLEVVCLFGKRPAQQLVDDACRLGISGTFFVVLDANLSATDRRTMAQYFFTQKNIGQASFLVIDRVLALYLAMQTENERLPAMLQCTLPYTIYQPFTNGSGSTADEVFTGRANELKSIRDMAGASIVYGGRQLGKTALLERAKHLDNNPEKNEYAVLASFKGCRDEKRLLSTLVGACNEEFAQKGIELAECSAIEEFTTQIRGLLRKERMTKLLLLMDEMDDFLESISAKSYEALLPLFELQRSSDHRFKFVLAGLHNVCRAENATRNNGLFPQLGPPLCVKPLTAADARSLLLRPLRYLGFRISNESHIDTILTNTNYYPGIIQFFGYTLVQTLASQYTQYYDAVRGNPPFELHDDQLAAIMNSRDLNYNIKERLRWTLEMDERYYMLARCIAVLYHLYGNDYSQISIGFDVAAIRDVAVNMFHIHCLELISESDTIALLDEMEEMGILSRPGVDGNHYLLRRRNFMDVIGTSLEALDHDIDLYNKEVTADAGVV